MAKEIDLEKLLEKASEAMRRDINHIFGEVGNGKLNDKSARDLVNYIKVLSDISWEKKKDDEKSKKNIEKMSDEDLAKMAAEILKK